MADCRSLRGIEVEVEIEIEIGIEIENGGSSSKHRCCEWWRRVVVAFSRPT